MIDYVLLDDLGATDDDWTPSGVEEDKEEQGFNYISIAFMFQIYSE